ncbi:RagB/SusD family nutrient uptake outer membrane protein [Parasediminibacterium sp. JCM 36343]|uniref:RagB/SusD family nutrient uptake outer membrane protein n=1 Tax=Parasediminibacterium sp. JCM 36343 TaxID=3374279 RepID=UPI00397D6996
MRNSKYTLIILSISLVFLLGSCTKFLETTPSSFVTPQSYYNTSAELNAALTGVYNVLSNNATYQNGLFATHPYGNDEGYFSRNFQVTGVQVYNYTASNADITALWDILYQGIERANVLLANINKPPMDSASRNEIKGEALFLRAYFYFLLVSKWGDVPLKLTPTTSLDSIAIARAPSVIVYNQIIADMKTADSLVYPITAVSTPGRVNKSCVEGILARVCLTMAGYPVRDVSKYTDAQYWASKVVQSGYHGLNVSYSQVFINQIQKIYDTKESLWEAEMYYNPATANVNNSGGSLGVTVGIICSNQNIGYSYGQIYATGLMYKMYDDTNDVRRDWNIANFVYSGTNKLYFTPKAIYSRCVGKWRREYELIVPKTKNVNATNFPLLRYADVLLMLAEAENELNGPTVLAHQYLNTVRSRAKAYAFTGSKTITDKDAFRQIIQNERARELCFEGLRKADLIRWGILYTTMKAVANDFSVNGGSNNWGAIAGNNFAQRYLLYPIPQYEISLNKLLVQNPGF